MELNKNFDPELTAYTPLIRPDWIERLAQYISVVCSPPLMVIVGIYIGTQTISTSSAWIWAFVFMLLSVLPPILYVLWLLRNGKITNFHLDVRDQRKGPILVILLNTVLVWMVLHAGGAPALLVNIATGGLILSSIILIITLRWKISGRCAAAAGLESLNCMLFGQEALLLAAIVPVVAWSRVQLRRHSLSQAIAGALLGGIAFAVVIYFTSNAR